MGNRLQQFFTTYDSAKYIQVRNVKVATAYRFIQIAILIYVIVFSVIIAKGYQAADHGITAITTKVKGSATTRNGLVFDEYDLVYPPVERDALFITTTRLVTKNQTMKTCPDPEIRCNCSTDKDCCPSGKCIEAGKIVGSCTGGYYCDIQGWCPTEDQQVTKPISFQGIENFTVFIRSNVYFQRFNRSMTNMKGSAPTRGYNLFTIGDLLELAGYTIDDVQQRGAIIMVTAKYDCNLDTSDLCYPEWSAKRLDYEPGISQFSTGFNYRYTTYDATEAVRSLYKVYGIRFLFQTSAIAKKFDILTLTTTLGAGLALLSISTIIADFVLQYLTKKRKIYVRNKFQDVLSLGSVDCAADPFVSPLDSSLEY